MHCERNNGKAVSNGIHVCLIYVYLGYQFGLQ